MHPTVEDALLMNSLSANPETEGLVIAIGRARRIHDDWQRKITSATAQYETLQWRCQHLLGELAGVNEGIAQKRSEIATVTNDLEKARRELERVDREMKKRKAELNKLNEG
jgi:chromosome segregation ATPase